MIMDTTHWYEVVGALGGGIGGIAAAVGAVAAWRAASASRATSRDAMDALALALAHRLRVECWAVAEPEGSDSGIWKAEICNESEFAATNVVLETRFRDGQRLRERIERLAGGAFETVPMRKIEPPPAGPTIAQAGEELVLRYADERSLGRYELRYLFLVKGGGVGEPTGGVMAEGPPRRIA
jgi:hypothetical protein